MEFLPSSGLYAPSWDSCPLELPFQDLQGHVVNDPSSRSPSPRPGADIRISRERIEEVPEMQSMMYQEISLMEAAAKRPIIGAHHRLNSKRKSNSVPQLSEECLSSRSTSLHKSADNVATLQSEVRKKCKGTTGPAECRWGSCKGMVFENVADLGMHLMDHIKAQRSSNAKKNESFCEWEGCTRVDKPLKSAYNLVHHLRYKHTGEKPYQCSMLCCESRFVQLSDLKEHMRNIHKVEDGYIKKKRSSSTPQRPSHKEQEGSPCSSLGSPTMDFTSSAEGSPCRSQSMLSLCSDMSPTLTHITPPMLTSMHASPLLPTSPTHTNQLRLRLQRKAQELQVHESPEAPTSFLIPTPTPVAAPAPDLYPFSYYFQNLGINSHPSPYDPLPPDNTSTSLLSMFPPPPPLSLSPTPFTYLSPPSYTTPFSILEQ